MPYTPTLDISVRFTLPTHCIWTALTDERLTSRWWPSLEFEPVQGGEFRIQTPRPGKKRPRTGAGRLIELEPGERVAIDLTSTPREFASQLSLTVSKAKQKTKVRIIESGLPAGQYAELIAAECRDGWREVLGAFTDFLDEESNVRRIERRCDR